MGRKVNPTAFRLGIVTFWKSELYSHNFSNIFKDFLDFYRLLKLALRVFGLELLSSKILGLGNSKFTILANFYRYALYKKRSWQWRKKLRRKKMIRKKKKKKLRSVPVRRVKIGKRLKLWEKGEHKKLAWRLRRRKAFGQYRWKRKKLLPRFRRYLRLRFRKSRFKKKISVKLIMKQLEFFFFSLLKKVVFVKLRSIFNMPSRKNFIINLKRNPKKGFLNQYFSPLRSSRVIYKSMKRFGKARFFEFLRDTVNVVNFSFLFVNSSILGYYLSKLIKFHRNIKFVVYKVKTVIERFKFYHLDHSSIRVSVFGKMKGPARTTSITFSCGSQWPLQTPTARLDYSLTQTWNVFGAYGVKIWLFNHMKTRKA